MKNIKYIILVLLVLSGCELITIGSKKPKPIEVSQKTPIGTVLLFKTELDSNNIPAATRILAKSDGKQFLAIQKYELYDEVARLQRLISNKKITAVKSDSLTESSYKVRVELDYLKSISFTTSKIKDFWYITDYNE